MLFKDTTMDLDILIGHFLNFGGYSKYNAQQFSDMKKQELNVSGYGDPSYVDHVMRYVGITFRGGTNPKF